MFAGVAASSMPTVHQFFVRKNISLFSLTSSLKSSFKQLRSGSGQEKLSDHDSRSRGREDSNLHGSGTCVVHGKDTADQVDFDRKNMGDSQIRLTQHITVTQEKRSHASFPTDVEANISPHDAT